MKNLKKLVVLTIILLASNSYSQPIMPGLKDPSQAAIHMQNAILAKVNKKTISVLDVKKKMDIFLAFDNDPAGKKYIQQFQERYSGVSFTLDLPPQEGQDWNDVLQSKQPIKGES